MILETKCQDSAFLFCGFLDDNFLRQSVSQVKIPKECIWHLRHNNSSDGASEMGNRTIFCSNLLPNSTFDQNIEVFDRHEIKTIMSSCFQEGFPYFSKTLDRVFLRPMGRYEKEVYFDNLLLFFYRFLIQRSNSSKFSIIFHASPHFPQEIALFFMAKSIGLKVIIIRKTLLDSCISFDRDFRVGHSSLLDLNFEDFSFFKNKKSTFDFLEKESEWLKTSKSIIKDLMRKSAKKRNLGLKRFTQTILSASKHIAKSKLKRNKLWYFPMTAFVYAKFIALRFITNSAHEDYLASKQVYNIDQVLQRSFVFLPLHYQPERSTDPECGDYSLQFRIIREMSQIIDDEALLLVKEHPRQGSDPSDIRQLNFRSIAYLKKMLELKNVRLVSSDFPSDILIDKCQLVVSGSGSSLWEANLRGKPSLSFGSTWHSDCASSPTISDFEDIQDAYTYLKKKSPEQVLSDVWCFLKVKRGCFLRSSNLEKFARNSSQDYNMLAKNLALGLEKALELEI